MIATLLNIVRRAVGGAALVLLLAAPPYALLRYLDSPLPNQSPTRDTVTAALTSPLTDEMIGAVLTALLWAAWVSFAWSVLAELAAALTGRRLPQPRVLSPGRGLAALLVAAITGGVLATAAQAASPPLTDTAHAHPSASGVAAATATVAHREPLPVSVTLQVAQVAALPEQTLAHGEVTLVANGREYTHTVKRGDTMSKIAEQWLGDANRWPEIFALNRGAHFTDVGGTLRNPNVIYPGWTLDLPADATPPSGQQPRPPAAASNQPGASDTPREPETAPSRPTPSAPTPRPQQPTETAPTPTSTPSGSAVTVPAPATSSADAPSPSVSGASQSERAHRGVWLPSGSWIDLGLALAIAAAVALVWARRQHRYVPRKPSAQPRLNDSTLTPMPAVVRQIRRGLRRADAGHPDPYEPEDLRPHADQRGVDEQDQLDAEPDGSGDAASDEHDDVARAGNDDRPAPGPVAPASDDPLSELWPAAGLGLVGHGAEAAARGFLSAALASGGVEHPEARTEVVIPSMTAATLLGAAAVTMPRTPRLTVTAGLEEALEFLETQTLQRTRLAYQHEVDSVAELRRAAPYEQPLPPIMLLADVTSSHERARVAALLAQGQRLDIHGILLGDWPDGDTVVVAADGTTTAAVDSDRARHGAHPADIGRLAVLDPLETADLLTTLAESHTGLPQAPAPTEPMPTPPAQESDPTAPEDAEDPKNTNTTGSSADTTAEDDNYADDAPGSAASPPGRQDKAIAPVPDAEEPPATDEKSTGHAYSEHAHESGSAQTTPARVQILGAPQVVDGDPQRTPRAKSLELLVYLAVNDGVASTEAILDDLLPDAPSSKAAARLYTYVSGLRALLGHASGTSGHVPHPDHRYLLSRDLLDVDLWRMREAIRDAARASDPHDRVAALRRAVEAYTGPLAEGCEYEWVESYREAIRQESLDASLALADALTGEPAEQLTVLDAAIAHSPHHEALYQAAMRARADLGHADGIRELRRTLTRRLIDIDAEPGDDTLALADRLIADLRRRGRTSGKQHPPDRDGPPQ
ncbi:BTAD domain-containing putative transcriptional regulator [Micromonospora sp. NPDC005324]|uniref:BTAD domain-containing putative transcriptional regulator n=1 Tax=Micromonospora sp. NPDC005324 TaxID=3157033 RepID=UPI0033B5BE24